MHNNRVICKSTWCLQILLISFLFSTCASTSSSFLPSVSLLYIGKLTCILTRVHYSPYFFFWGGNLYNKSMILKLFLVDSVVLSFFLVVSVFSLLFLSWILLFFLSAESMFSSFFFGRKPVFLIYPLNRSL